MFEYIRGKLIASSSGYAVIEAGGGVGYRLAIPPNSAEHLPARGEELLLYTSHVVREQSETLYGFIEAQQRDLFELLITISGIGPKIALSLIGHTTLAELRRSVQNEETAPLCRVPGIGKKSASRILVEMRDKLPQLYERLEITERPSLPNTPAEDAVSALINLGYSRSAAQRAVELALEKTESKTIELASLITLALKQ